MRHVIALASLLALSSCVAAEPALKVAGGWIREAPPTAPVRAGYLALSNPGLAEAVVKGASSEAFAAIEIHEMVATDDGTMRMRPVPELRVPAGGEVRLEPGGTHLMLFRPVRALAAGDPVPLTLELADGRTITAVLEQR